MNAADLYTESTAANLNGCILGYILVSMLPLAFWLVALEARLEGEFAMPIGCGLILLHLASLVVAFICVYHIVCWVHYQPEWWTSEEDLFFHSIPGRP